MRGVCLEGRLEDGRARANGATSLAGPRLPRRSRPGYKVSTASYVVSLFSPKVVSDLELPRFGYHVYPLDPAYFAPFPDGSGFLLWDDPVLASQEIGKINARDGRAYLEYNRHLGELADLVRPLLYRRPPDPGVRSFGDVVETLSLGRYAFGNRRSISRLVDLMTMSCADFLDRFFVDERVKGALTPGGVIGMWGGPMSPGSAYVLLHHRMGEIDGVTGGWGFVRGGMGGGLGGDSGLARAAGAEIRTDAEVAAMGHQGRTMRRALPWRDGNRFEAGMTSPGAPLELDAPLVSSDGRRAGRDVRGAARVQEPSPSAKVNLGSRSCRILRPCPARSWPQHPEISIGPTLEYWSGRGTTPSTAASEGPMIDAVIPTYQGPDHRPRGQVS